MDANTQSWCQHEPGNKNIYRHGDRRSEDGPDGPLVVTAQYRETELWRPDKALNI